MSAWVTITVDDLRIAKVAALVTALQTAALGAGQTDPVVDIIANVILRIRDEIKGCPRNQLDADATLIPPGLKPLAMRMIVREAQSRLKIPLKPDETDEKKDDLRYLERIAKCEVPISAPDNPVPGDQQVGTTQPTIKARRHRFGRCHEEGA